MVYAACTYEGAILEQLVRLRTVPSDRIVIVIDLPDSLEVEEFPQQDLSWSEDSAHTRSYGDEWLRLGRSAVCIVPGRVAMPFQQNALLNPSHPDFGQIRFHPPRPVVWDPRLFQ